MRIRPILLALALAACGSSTPTTPTNSGGTNPIADISGVWTLSFSSMTGAGLTCSTSSISMTISDSAGAFTGNSTSSWFLTCATPGTDPTVVAQTGAKVTDGSVRGNSVNFSLATSASSQFGTYNSSTSISGTATWNIEIGGYPYTLNGNFSMTR